MNPDMNSECLKFQGPRVTFFQVQQLKQLLEIKSEFPDAKLVVGNTEIGQYFSDAKGLEINTVQRSHN